MVSTLPSKTGGRPASSSSRRPTSSQSRGSAKDATGRKPTAKSVEDGGFCWVHLREEHCRDLVACISESQSQPQSQNTGVSSNTPHTNHSRPSSATSQISPLASDKIDGDKSQSPSSPTVNIEKVARFVSIGLFANFVFKSPFFFFLMRNREMGPGKLHWCGVDAVRHSASNDSPEICRDNDTNFNATKTII